MTCFTYIQIPSHQFACHLASCTRLFLTPKARRLHLIQAHGYPKEYFFAVTNKGVGGLLKRWGEGVSLIRGPWKARDSQGNKKEDGNDSDDSEEDDEMVNPPPHMDSQNDKHDQEYGDIANDKEKFADGTNYANRDDDPSVDGLTRTMGSLNLVPPSIRFGRGGKSGGFAQNGRTGDPVMDSPARGHFRGRERIKGWQGRPTGVMEIDPPGTQPSRMPPQALGRGSRGGLGWAGGRGRAGIVHVPRGHRGRGRAVAIARMDG